MTKQDDGAAVAAAKVRKPRGSLDAGAHARLVAFLRAHENHPLTIDGLTAGWNASQSRTPRYQLSADRIAEIMRAEKIRDATWRAGTTGQRVTKEIRDAVALEERTRHDRRIETRRTAQRKLFSEIAGDEERRSGLKEIECPDCSQPCFNTSEFFPVDRLTRKINPRRCIICRDIRRRRYDRSQTAGGDKAVLLAEKKADSRRAVDAEAQLRRARLDLSGGRILRTAPETKARRCVGCRTLRPLRVPYFLRIMRKGGPTSYSLLCSPCENDFDRKLERARADGKAALAAQIKRRRQKLLAEALENQRRERRALALKKAGSWKGPRAVCPQCTSSWPLTRDYFFVRTLVRSGRRGEVARDRRNCRFCESDKEAAARKPKKKKRKGK